MGLKDDSLDGAALVYVSFGSRDSDRRRNRQVWGQGTKALPVDSLLQVF